MTIPTISIIVRENLQACLPGWIKDKREVILYAAGGLTQALVEEKALGNLRVISIVDRDPALHGTRIGPYEVRPVEDIEEFAPILVIVASPDSHYEIIQDLRQRLQDPRIEIVDLCNPQRLAAKRLPPDVSDLTRCVRIEWAILEFTTKCNLRCIYCVKSLKKKGSRKSFEFPEASIFEMIEVLRMQGLRHILCSGIGETTTREGWDRICRSLLDSGISLAIITNLARPLKPDEASTLARFATVQISVDTCDPVLFAKIRRGAKLKTITDNMLLITSQAKNMGLSPELRFDAVVTDKTIFHLPDLVRFGVELGVKDFYFADLYKNPDQERVFDVYNVSDLPVSQIRYALQALESAERIARDAGCNVSVHQSLVENLQLRMNATSSVNEISPSASIGWGAQPPPDGFTRDCQDPWTYAFLRANGKVGPCCTYNRFLGNLFEKSILDILNDEPARSFRQQLLTGDLHGTMCLNCALKPIIPVETLKNKILEARLGDFIADKISPN